MLGDKCRITSHWCLFAVILRILSSDPGIYELKCVLFDGFETFGSNVITTFGDNLNLDLKDDFLSEFKDWFIRSFIFLM